MPNLDPEIIAPAGYIPESALAFDDGLGKAITVSAQRPLPSRRITLAAASTPLSGTMATSGSVGPFRPDAARPIWLSLSGTWSGTARLMRSTDGGATKQPLTVGGESWGTFSGNANEAVVADSDVAATYYLDVTLSTGTVAYRVSQ